MTPRTRTAESSPSTETRQDDAERVRPFDSGTHYTAWMNRNCIGCSKFDAAEYRGRCEIDGALGEAYFGDGRVSGEIADRMGYTEAHADTGSGRQFPWTWACPEREARS